jgi:16S rRNA pseudouridine516 synthase
MKIEKLLTQCGYCTRAEVVKFLRKHNVISTSDNKAVTSPTFQVKHTHLTIDGEPADNPTDSFTILLHKPPGYICSTVRDYAEAKIVYDLLPERFLRRNPTLGLVGRLDANTSGLVFLTQNGKLNNDILSTNIEKTYDCVFIPPFENAEEFEAIKKEFENGVQLKSEKYACRPATIEMLCNNAARVTIREGMYHQVRRMFAACSKRVVALTRVGIGHMTLRSSNLKIGEWRVVDEAELAPYKNSK